jgi:hypothetical protein
MNYWQFSHYPLNGMASAWFGFYIAYSKQLKDEALPTNILELSETIKTERFRHPSELKSVSAFQTFVRRLSEKPNTQNAMNAFLETLKKPGGGVVRQATVQALCVFDFPRFRGSGWNWHGMLLYVTGGYFKQWNRCGQMMVLRLSQENFEMLRDDAEDFAGKKGYWSDPLTWRLLSIKGCQLYPPFGRVKMIGGYWNIDFERPMYDGTQESASALIEFCKDISKSPEYVASVIQGKAAFRPELYVLNRYRDQFVFFEPFITTAEVTEIRPSWQDPLVCNLKLKIAEVKVSALMHQYTMLLDANLVKKGRKYSCIGLCPIGVEDYEKWPVFCLSLSENETPQCEVFDSDLPSISLILDECLHRKVDTQQKMELPVVHEAHPPSLSHRITLITLQDFVDYGKVYRVLKEKPDANPKEIAQKTGLYTYRVLQMLEAIKQECKPESVQAN